MPSSPEPFLDERFAELAALLRDARPRPSEELRAHVRRLALTPAAARPERRRFPPRRLLTLAPALVLAAALAAGIGVLASRTPSTGGADEEAAVGTRTLETLNPAPATAEADQSGTLRGATTPGGVLPPAGRRAQEYRAELRVHVGSVDELSSLTSSAMRITRSLGGYVVTASYDAPGGGDGDSLLVVRVPVRRVQDAIFQFSQLGSILAQHVSVADLQAQLDRQADAIAAIRRTIVRLETRLEDSTLSPETRERLRLQLLDARRTRDARQAGRSATKQRAATARVALTLTTRDEAQPAPPPPEGRFERTLRDALSVLGAVLTWLLAGLIVLSPVVALGLLAAVLLRLRRRAEERRLLERPTG
jgi:Domain of unknown function (DUF4349)